MQLVLQIDERVVAGKVEADVTEDACNYARSDCCRLWLYNDLHQVLRLVLDHEARKRFKTEVHSKGRRDAFDAQKVVAIGSDLDFVNILCRKVYSSSISIDSVHLHLISRAVFQFDSKLEA